MNDAVGRAEIAKNNREKYPEIYAFLLQLREVFGSKVSVTEVMDGGGEKDRG